MTTFEMKTPKQSPDLSDPTRITFTYGKSQSSDQVDNFANERYFFQLAKRNKLGKLEMPAHKILDNCFRRRMNSQV